LKGGQLNHLQPLASERGREKEGERESERDREMERGRERERERKRAGSLPDGVCGYLGAKGT